MTTKVYCTTIINTRKKDAFLVDLAKVATNDNTYL